MIEKIFIRKMLGKNGISGPVEIKVRAILPDELGHADMVITVGIKKGWDRKLGKGDNEYTD